MEKGKKARASSASAQIKLKSLEQDAQGKIERKISRSKEFGKTKRMQRYQE